MRPPHLAELEELRARVADQERVIAGLEGSLSWRITGPLRWGKAVLASLRQVPGTAARQHRLGGGGLRGLARVARWAWHRLRYLAYQPSRRPWARTAAERDYGRWLEAREPRDAAEREILAAQATELAAAPGVSLVLVVEDPAGVELEATLESVADQLLPCRGLRILAPDPGDPARDDLLARWLAEHPWAERVPPATSLAAALGGAPGEFVAMLEAGDQLAPDALARVAAALLADPELDLVYADEDRVDAGGRRMQPQLKPGWSPELLLAGNYVGRPMVLRRRLVEDLAEGPGRPPSAGASTATAEYDLLLRLAPDLDPGRVRRLPRVLLHRRLAPGPPPPRQVAAVREALRKHLGRLRWPGTVEENPLVPGGLRVRLALPAEAPLASLVIPTRDAPGLLRRCVESVRGRTGYPRFEVVLVDNGSQDPEALAILDGAARLPAVQVLRDPEPFHFSRLVNAGIRASRGEVVVLLNNDTEVLHPEWLEELVTLAIRPGVGVVGARLLYPDDSLQHGGVILGVHGVAAHAHLGLPYGAPGPMGRAASVQNLSAVTAACMAVRRVVFDEVGGFDETQLGVAYGDVDFCLRVGAAGHRVVWTPFAELYHHEGASRGVEDDPTKRARILEERVTMLARWGREIAADPFYHPDLARDQADFGLSWSSPASPSRNQA